MRSTSIINMYIFSTVSFLLFDHALSNENYTEIYLCSKWPKQHACFHDLRKSRATYYFTESANHSIQEKKAVKWLLGERQADWGWGGFPTAYALIALQVIDFGDRLDRELSAKQLEIDLVLQLWRHHEKPALTSAQIGLYALALSSSCQDPRQFHGIDLIGSLLHHTEPDSDSEFALCSLAMCSAGTHVRKRHLRRLLNIANTKHNVDSLSGVLLALKCIVRDHRNRNMQHYLKKPVLALARSQLPDGSFGNVLSTSVAIQALGEDSASWNKTAAINWIKSQQNSDGSFNDIPTTANVIMALYDKGIGSVKDIDCDEREDLEEEENADGAIIPHLVTSPKIKNDVNKNKNLASNKTDGMDESGGDGTNAHEDATVTYTLWVGSNVTENRTTTLTVTHNSTFYNVMQLAAEHDNKYTFAATEWPNGHYVHTLAGFKEQPMSYHYWLLYRLPNLPDPNNPPGNQFVAPTGVDDLIVKDGEHYLFWYKKL